MKILIVDDEVEILKALAKDFEKRGNTVVTACNGEQALQTILADGNPDTTTFDAILTDHRMPVMSGIEFIKELRKHKYTQPIVLVSGDNEAKQNDEIRKEVVALLPKPTSLVAIRRLFGQLESTKTVTAQTADKSPSEQPKSALTGEQRIDVNGETPKILIVDDEAEIRKILAKILATEHYQTEQACDGIEALEKLQNKSDTSKPFDLLIIDLRMPHMSGQALLDEIRKVDALIPIIVLTGHADHRDAYALLSKYQISDFHQKPLKSNRSLLFSVRNALDKAQLQRSLTLLNQRYQMLNQELEQRVEQRTRELKHQTELATKANKAKSEFLDRMSHELRTPLNAILGFTQIYEFQLENKHYDHIKQSLPMVLQAGRHLLRMIDDTLEIEHLEEGNVEISLQTCQIDPIINDCLSQLAQPIEQMALKVLYSNTKLAVIADESRLKQVLQNLLSNAVKFNRHSGNLKIEIKTVEAQMIDITIIDSGVGIEQSEFELLFEPFTRLKYANQEAIDGIGNGLAICKLLTAQMNGSIQVASVVGQGSQFTLRLQQSH